MANIIDLLLRLTVDSAKAKQQIAEDFAQIQRVGVQAGRAVTQAVQAATPPVGGAGAFSQMADSLTAIRAVAPGAAASVASISASARSLAGATTAQLDAVANSLLGIQKTAPGAATGLQGVGNAAGGGANNLKQFATQATSSTAALEGMFTSLKTVGAAIIGLGIVQTLKGWADQAARTQVLGTVLDQVALNAGISQVEVRTLDQNIQKLGITAAASRTALTSFIQSGLDVSKAAALARASQDLAVVAGEDSSTVFQRVILNVQQLDTVGLKYNGVIVQMEEATKNYLAALGQQNRELTRAEQQQALLNEVLRKAGELSGVYEKSMGDVGKQLSSLNRLQNDAAVSLGNNLLPAYLVLVQEFSTFLKEAKLITDAFSDQSQGARQLAESIRPIAVALRELAVVVVQNIQLIAQLVAAYTAIKVGSIVFGAVTAAATQFGGVLLSLIRLMVSFGVATLSVATGGLPALVAGLRAATAAGLAFLATPLGLGIVALGLIIAGTYAYIKAREQAAKIDALSADGGKKLNAQLVANLTERLQLVEAIAKSEAELVEAQNDGDTDRIKAASEQLKQQKDRLKDLETEKSELLEIAKAKKIDTSANEAAAEANKARLNITKQAQAVTDVLTKLKLDTTDAMRGLNIDTEFSKQTGQVVQIMDAFADQVKKTSGEVVVSANQVFLASRGLLEGAKTFDEINKAIELIRSRGNTSSPLIQNLLDTAEFNRAKAGMAELDKELGGFIARSQEAARNQSLLRGLAEDSAGFVTGMRTAFAELGAGLSVSSRGIIEVTGALTGLAASRRTLAEAEAATTNLSVASLSDRYRAEQTAIEQLDAKKRQSITDNLNSQRNTDALLLALDKETNQKKADNAKTYYDGLKQQQDAYTQKIRESLTTIRGLENDLRSSQRSREQDILNLRNQGLNEFQQKQAQIDRASELSTRSRLALARGDLEASREAAEDQLTIARNMASSAKTAQERLEAETAINRAYDDRDAVTKKQLADAKEELAIRIESQNQLTRAMNNLRDTLGTLLTEGKEAKINLNVDRSQLDAVYKKLDEGVSTKVSFTTDPNNLQALKESVEQAMAGISFVVNASIGRTEGFATGGKLRGPGTGTSDSIPIWGSNGEWMIREKAVRYYGDDFMHMVNTMSLPRAQAYATGGAISTAGPGAMSTSSQIDQMDVNINLGGRRVATVRTSRQQARDLADALQEIGRGING